MFGQVVVGPPGSGKTTYCRGMRQFLRGLGRNAVVINLDPANDPSDVDTTEGEGQICALDINELVSLEDVMEELGLGPNGGMVYCLEFLEANLAWLEDALREMLREDPYTYFIFDLPGQVEISACHESLRNIMLKVRKDLDLRLTAVHLVDAVHCSDPSKYIAAVFLSLSTMMRLELPHVNVLSKVDLVENEGALAFNLDFYTQVMDLDYLLPLLSNTPVYNLPSVKETAREVVEEAANDEPKRAEASVSSTAGESEGGELGDKVASEEDDVPAEPPGPPRTFFEEKFKRLNTAIVDLIDQFSLVAFHPLNIQDKESMVNLLKHIDKTNEYVNVISPAERDLLSHSGDYLDMSAMLEKYSGF